MSDELRGTFVTKHGRRVVASPVESGEIDLEYLDADGEVVKYRPKLPVRTVQDIARLEGWTRPS